MADDHNDDPPNEFAAAFSNSESSNDELEGNNEPAENAQEELAAATLQGTEVEAIVAQEPAVASLQRSTVFQEPAVASLQRSTRFQEPAVMAAHDMPDQPQDREDPGYEDKEMTDSIKGAHDLLYLKHTILDYETARKLEHMKSKILSGIDLNSTSGSKQKALRIQESEATNGAAQGRRELQFEQEEGGGGLFYGNYSPPDLPPITSLENLIQDCSKPFEKQLTPSDVSKTPRLCLNKEYVDNHIKPVLRNGENPNEGINVTTYDMDGNEYPMKFTTWGTYLYVLSQGWKNFCHDLGLVETQDFLTLWVFRHVNNRGLCFAIQSRRLPVFETIKKRRQRRQN
ncbi:hypothetical protein Pyn_22061 [Prunus yedoensis var. nudiflora]|uniref:TF-B3 domain-containing protein n=1 Tax=Prunus yedoensis var. nudiflora TaxID=2094558 RepID=A0A314YIU6_PRUYE|nr:hypothetical protein Pyn_22061 [Prunus yedoensis var. nudiflora]